MAARVAVRFSYEGARMSHLADSSHAPALGRLLIVEPPCPSPLSPCRHPLPELRPNS